MYISLTDMCHGTELGTPCVLVKVFYEIVVVVTENALKETLVSHT